MNTINQTLFTARVTEEQLPKLSVDLTGSGFTRRNAPCEQLTVGVDKQLKISLGNKTVEVEGVTSLASGGDYGKSLTVRQVSQTDYAYEDEDGVSVRVGSLSHVILQVQNASLVAEFARGGAAGPVVPMMTGAGAPVPVGQAAGGVNVPANVQPAVAVAAIPAVPAPNAPSQDKLTGSLTGLMPVEWELYTNCLQQPHLSYTAQYQEFLQKEKALLASKSNPFSAILPPPAPCGTGGKAVPVVSSPAPEPGVVNAPAAVVPVFDFGEFARKLQAGEIPAPGKQAKQNQ